MNDLITSCKTVALDSVLTKDEWIRMVQSSEDGKDQVIMALGVLGLRAAEIGACQREWVDLSRQTIALPTGATKRSKGRVVPFGRFRIVKDIISSFFTLERAVGLSRIAVWNRVKGLASRAGISRPITVHGLRATGASWMAQSGYQANALREHFGWAALNTAEHYIEKSGASAMRAMEELGEKIL